jgi:hypothetical protein
MKTTMDIYFELEGITRRDNFALQKRDVKRQADELCDKLASEANPVLQDIPWPGDFPQFPEDRLRYEQAVQLFLAPITLEAVMAEIKDILDTQREQVFTTLALVKNKLSSFSREFDESTWVYEFRSSAPNLCIPQEPPPGGHISTPSVYYSTGLGSSTFHKFPWPIESQGQVYTYTIECSLGFSVESESED